jgi:hypothetical protein
MPSRKPPKRQSYAEYAGFFTPEMRRRAKAAGCITIMEVAEWLDRHYGRDQNHSSIPPPYRRPK